MPTDNTYAEVDGVISFEIEQVAQLGAWKLQNSVPGHSGTGYFYWDGGDILKDPSANDTLVESTLAITLRVKTPGTYQMTIASRRNQSGVCAGAASDQCNDVYTKVNDGQWCKTLVKGAWDEWITNTRLECAHGKFTDPLYDLVVGDNTLLLTGRSRGVHIDKIRFDKK